MPNLVFKDGFATIQALCMYGDNEITIGRPMLAVVDGYQAEPTIIMDPNGYEVSSEAMPTVLSRQTKCKMVLKFLWL